MLEDSEKVKSLRNKVASLKDDYFKIEYLQSLIKDQEKVDLEVLAFINETLGQINIGLGMLKPGYFEKAASNWEVLAMTYGTNKDDSRRYRRNAFLRALDNYHEAVSIYKEKGLFFQAEQAKEKIAAIKSELRKQDSLFRQITVFLLASAFILSFLLLSSAPTGFVISPLETGGTITVGILLAFLALLGSFITLRFWG